MSWWLIFIAGWLIFFAWFAPSPFLLPFLKHRHLPLLAAENPETTPPVSVIVPARDEEAKIEPCLRSLLAMEYPDLEILAVDDRSGDTTGQIMDRIAAEDPRVRVLHIKELPPGWIGKTHAMHQAVQRARGTHLLFTDGDIRFAPRALNLAMSFFAAAEARSSEPFSQTDHPGVLGNRVSRHDRLDVFLLLQTVVGAGSRKEKNTWAWGLSA